MKILGILNITEDSFSDGGNFLAPKQALAHATRLMENGADVIDIGPASSHPNSKSVGPSSQIERLRPVLASLPNLKRVSIDSTSVEVQSFALDQGVGYLNDIRGFPEPDFYPRLAESTTRLIVMHSISQTEIAKRMHVPAHKIVDKVLDFFDRRVSQLVDSGISTERLILDPGMGFFLGTDPMTSVEILRRIHEVRARFALPVLVSVSRKSFLQTLTQQDANATQAASLVSEIYCFDAGVEYVRTHEPGQLRQGVQVWKTLRGE
jgi:dihydropteroate synthase type 2